MLDVDLSLKPALNPKADLAESYSVLRLQVAGGVCVRLYADNTEAGLASVRALRAALEDVERHIGSGLAADLFELAEAV